MNARRPRSVLLAFSIKNIFYDKMELGLFYFRATKYYIATKSRTQKKLPTLMYHFLMQMKITLYRKWVRDKKTISRIVGNCIYEAYT